MSDATSRLLPAPKLAKELAPLSYSWHSGSLALLEVVPSQVAEALSESLRRHQSGDAPQLELTHEELTGAAPEAYELIASGHSVTVRASTEAGRRCALLTLTQWLRLHEPGALVTGLSVIDEPDLRERGVMLDVSRDRVPTMAAACQLIELLASVKINQLQLYTEHTFAYTGAEHIWGSASPWTASEIAALDAFAASWGVELVPNQQSFGHMHRWLSHDSHRHLSEVPGGVEHPFHHERQPFSLCPTDPACIAFLAQLYDELLPNFTSLKLNVGLDETFDLGQGRSKQAVEERGVAAVYLDFLREVHQLVAERGRTMQCWADILLHHPEVVPELPQDCEPILWGYEASHPLMEEAEVLSRSCASFQIAPGTSSWQSLGGRTDNCVQNLRAAAAAGRRWGAGGLLITDWGDRGHLQPMPISYLGFIHGAECAWNGAAAEARSDAELAQQLDLFAFKDTSSGLGKLALELGRAADACGVETQNMTALFYPIGFPERTLPDERVPGLSPASYEIGMERVRALQGALNECNSSSTEAQLCHAELRWVVDLMETSCALGGARTLSAEGSALSELKATNKREIAEKLNALAERHAALWLVRSRPGGLEDSAERLLRVSAALGAT